MNWLRIFWEAEREVHLESLKELVTIIFISTTPVWLGGFVNFSSLENQERTISGYIQILERLLSQGELFLYCMSIVASITWLTNKELPGGSFPFRLFFNVFALIAFGVSVVFFGIDLVKVRLDQSVLLYTSQAVYFASIFIYYFVVVFNRIGPPNLKEVRSGEDESFSISLGRHRRK